MYLNVKGFEYSSDFVHHLGVYTIGVQFQFFVDSSHNFQLIFVASFLFASHLLEVIYFIS